LDCGSPLPPLVFGASLELGGVVLGISSPLSTFANFCAPLRTYANLSREKNFAAAIVYRKP
jgi:hypothetical protein